MTTGTNHATLISMLLALILTLSTAHADVTVISTRTEIGPGGAKFVEMKKEITLPGRPKTEINYMTDTRFVYTAPGPREIESFAIVQWIRGCLFTSDATGHQELSISRDYFGQVQVFQHRHWQIDSDSTDPVYTSNSKYGRFALLQWNKNPADLDANTSTYYAKQKPPHGTVFATDLPGSGFAIDRTHAQNTSLEFRTCLFHTRDLPATTDPDGTNVDSSKAIWCATWDHKNVWDFTAGKITHPTQIDPICDLN